MSLPRCNIGLLIGSRARPSQRRSAGEWATIETEQLQIYRCRTLVHTNFYLKTVTVATNCSDNWFCICIHTVDMTADTSHSSAPNLRIAHLVTFLGILSKAFAKGHSRSIHPKKIKISTRPSPNLMKLGKNDANDGNSLNPKFCQNWVRGYWNMTFWTFDLFDKCRVPLNFEILISQQPLGLSTQFWCHFAGNWTRNPFLPLSWS